MVQITFWKNQRIVEGLYFRNFGRISKVFAHIRHTYHLKTFENLEIFKIFKPSVPFVCSYSVVIIRENERSRLFRIVLTPTVYPYYSPVMIYSLLNNPQFLEKSSKLEKRPFFVKMAVGETAVYFD